MTIKSFIDTWNGKYCNIDGKFGNQCTDITRQFIKDVFGLNPYSLAPVTYAKELYTKFSNTKQYTRTANGKYNFPKQGDIIVFGPYPFLYGWAGHVAIVWDADPMNIYVFEQNYPTGSPCRLSKKSYKGCYGWITKKV